MKTIAKHFDSIDDAEKFQNELYDHYDYVKLVRFPLFSKDGTYTWEVKEKAHAS